MGKNPLMDELKKKIDLPGRLNMYFLFEYIDNNGETTVDYSVGQLYADSKTQDIMKIVNNWQNDGSPE